MRLVTWKENADLGRKPQRYKFERWPKQYWRKLTHEAWRASTQSHQQKGHHLSWLELGQKDRAQWWELPARGLGIQVSSWQPVSTTSNCNLLQMTQVPLRMKKPTWFHKVPKLWCRHYRRARVDTEPSAGGSAITPWLNVSPYPPPQLLGE